MTAYTQTFAATLNPSDFALAFTYQNNQYVAAPYTFPTTGYTIMFWYRSNATFQNNEGLFAQSGSFSLQRQGLNDIQLYAYINASADFAGSRRLRFGGMSDKKADGLWHSRAYILYVDGTNHARVDEYEDGVIKQSGIGTNYNGDTSTPSGNLSIGSGGSGDFNGSLARVMISNSVLTAADVTKFNNLILPTTLNAYWTMNEGIGTTVNDRSGNGNTGAFTGSGSAPVWTTGVKSNTFTRINGMPFVATLTTTGAIVRIVKKTLTASSSFAGSMMRYLNHLLVLANLSHTGSFHKTPAKLLPAAALTSSGNLARSDRKIMTGTTSFIGAISNRNIVALLTGSLGYTGNIARSINHTLTGASSFTGNVSRTIKHLLIGNLTETGAVSSNHTYAKSLAAAALSFLGGGTNRTNMITNPSFETGLTSWTQYGGTPSGTLVTSAAQAYVGAQSALAGCATAISGGGYAGGLQYTANNLVVGQSYVLSGYFQGVVGGENLNIYPSTSGQQNFNLTTYWQRCYITFVATAASMILYLRSSTTNANWYADAIQLETGTVPSVYFDGSQAGAYWSGTANASASIIGQVQRKINKNNTGSLTLTGLLNRGKYIFLTAAVTYSGNLARRAGRVLSGALGYSGSMTRFVSHIFVAGVTPNVAPMQGGAGIGTNGFGQAGFGQGDVSAGNGNGFSKQIGIPLIGVVSYTGKFSRVIGKNITAVVSYTGKFGRQITRALTATMSYTGVFYKIPIKTFTGSVGYTGNFLHQMHKNLTATLTYTGSMLRRFTRALTASVSPAGSLLKTTQRQLASAALSLSGLMTRRVNKTFTGSVTIMAIHMRQAQKSFVSTLSLFGQFVKIPNRVLTASLNFVGHMNRAIAKHITSKLSFHHVLLSRKKTHVRPTDTIKIDPNAQDNNVAVDSNDVSKSLEV